MNEPERPAVVVVGAGLAGLRCALSLAGAGQSVRVLEASDAVGGRVRTDEKDGFLLDRGFQVLLTAYPEVRRCVDLGALELGRFEPGALVRWRGRFHRLVDPLRRPLAAASAWPSDVASLADGLRTARLRWDVVSRTDDELLDEAETSTDQLLRCRGFSEPLTEAFFRPFFGGVFLERELGTSSRMMHFVFKMFALGEAALPARGMRALPEQLAARLPSGAVRLGSPVAKVRPRGVTLADGTELGANRVIVATDQDAARQLLGEEAVPRREWNGTACLSFAADQDPVGEPTLVLDGDGTGPVNHLCVPSAVAPGHAPPGAALVSASTAGAGDASDAELEAGVRGQLARWFGPAVRSWRLLATTRVPHALPDQSVGALPRGPAACELPSGVIACGDWLTTASIDGALRSGRVAAAIAGRPEAVTA